SSRRRHTRLVSDWSSDVCSSDLLGKAENMTDDRIRISDADRERVVARLREHFAQGRLSSDELDERISAALTAKTVGDLRPIMARSEERRVGKEGGWLGWRGDVDR